MRSNSNGTVNGKSQFYNSPDSIPGELINRNVKDVASRWPGAPPNFGLENLPHIFTVVGRYGLQARTYSKADEALWHSSQNAEIMRNEPAIMECLEARMRCTALLNCHVQPLDNDELRDKLDTVEDQRMAESLKRALKRSMVDAKTLATKINQILRHTPKFGLMRYSLMEAIWYGRQATVQRFGTRIIGDKRSIYVKSWEPRHGDKLVFRYDDGTYQYDSNQVGIRIGPSGEADKTFIDYAGFPRSKVEPTEHGMVYWLDGQERKRTIVHKHIIEDGDFNVPHKAGSIHGIGIRSRIYWTWWAYQEVLKLLLEYAERSALGIEIWRYPAHNPQAKERVTDAAKNRGTPGRNVIMFPVTPGENSEDYGIQIVEPGLAGLQELKSILQEFFGHKIKRYILGQVLSSEAEATGMGSGVADAHLATLHDIVRFDGQNLEETLSTDLVRPLQEWNFPSSDDVYLRMVIDTESPDAMEKLTAYQTAWAMGASIRTEDIYNVLGSAKPQENEDVLLNPAFQQQAPMPQPQQQAAPAMFGPYPGGDGSSDGAMDESMAMQ